MFLKQMHVVISFLKYFKDVRQLSLKYYSNRVELVHGYRCAWLRTAFLRLILPDLTYVAKIYQMGLYMLC